MSTSNGQSGTTALRDREEVTVKLTGEQAERLRILFQLMKEEMAVNLVNDIRDIEITINEQLDAA